MSVVMEVAGLALDEKSRAPIVVLKAPSGNQVLPIVVGIMEASAIAAQLEGVDFPRPMTHDLLALSIKELGGEVLEVEICDLINDTFYARIRIKKGSETLELDARPSDSIALALRTGAPIIVAQQVLEASSQNVPVGGGDDEAPWDDILENLDDEDFGRYKM
jgi:bifunctional DNase/RNase